VGESLSVPNGELRVVDNVPSAFADIVAEEVHTALADPDRGRDRSGKFRLVLSGGATARSCYQQLAARPGLDWAFIECLVGDERCVSPDHPDANQKMILEVLVERVVPHPKFVPMDCDAPQAYELVLRSTPHLDLVHLGLGPDGHTASLFPGSSALEAPPDRLVEHNVDPSGRNPHDRLTLTLAGISRARLVIFTVAGREKHEAMQRVLNRVDLPATRVSADRVIWLCDPGAIDGETLAVG